MSRTRRTDDGISALGSPVGRVVVRRPIHDTLRPAKELLDRGEAIGKYPDSRSGIAARGPVAAGLRGGVEVVRDGEK